MITSSAKVYRAVSDVEQKIVVTASAHVKCDRCWHYRADIGLDKAHPQICGRCVSNLFGAGEVRTYA
jgi:isoleucyl-tRNA synthetase